MKKLIFLLLLFSATGANAQTWSHTWGRNLAHPSAATVTALTTTPSGDIYSAVCLKNGSVFSGTDGGDIVLTKRDTAGTILWQKTIPGTAHAFTLKYGSDHNLIMAGAFINTLVLGSDTLVNNAPGFSCSFLAKLDSAGTVLWANSDCGSQQRKFISNVALDAQNNIYAIGLHLSLQGLFAKYNPAGDLVWRKPLPTVRAVSDVVIGPDNEVYITATGDFNMVFDTVATGITPPANYVTVLVKYLQQPGNQEPTAVWLRKENYNTFDQANALLYHNNSVYWLHDRQIAQNTRRKFLSRYSPSGAQLADTIQFRHKHTIKVNRFSGMANGSVVWAQAYGDSTHIVTLDSTLSQRTQIALKAPDWQMSLAGISIYGNNLVIAGKFKGNGLPFGNYLIPNANYATGTQLFDTYIGLLSWPTAPVVSAADRAETSVIKLYPNPAAQIVHLGGVRADKVQLLDITGREVLRAEKTDNLHIGQLPPGLYMVHVFVGEKVIVQKLIKQ